MSWKATSAAKDHSEARGGARLLLLVMADTASEWGMGWAGLEHLSHGCRVDARTVQRNMERLEEAGEIALFPRPGMTTVYVLMLPGLRSPSKQEAAEFAQMVGARGHDFLSGVTFRARDAVRTVSNRPVEDLKKNDADPRQNARGSEEDRFAEFWSLYPARSGRKLEKAKAEAQWKRLKPAERDAALVAVRNYARACGGGETLAKDAFRWIRDRSFEEWSQAPQQQNRYGQAPPADVLRCPHGYPITEDRDGWLSPCRECDDIALERAAAADRRRKAEAS